MIRSVWIGVTLLLLIVLGAGIAGTYLIMRPPPAPPAAGLGPGYGPPPEGPPAPRGRRPTELIAILAATFVLGGGTLLGGWAMVAALSRTQLAPMEQTTAALAALADGDFSKRVVTADGDPRVARLAHAYNRAAETVARVFEERRAAARESQRFLADAGHELRTPLTIVSGYLDIIGADAMDAATFERVTTNMRVETVRMRTLVEKMLLLARIESSSDRAGDVDLRAAIGEVVDAARMRHPGRTIAVSGSVHGSVRADADDVNEAIGNIVENALKYAPDSVVDVVLREDESNAYVEISDDGPGISRADRSLIFERFYRGEGRGTTDGVGLGLAIVRSAAERWNGDVTLLPDTSRTTFRLRFPKEATA